MANRIQFVSGINDQFSIYNSPVEGTKMLITSAMNSATREMSCKYCLFPKRELFSNGKRVCFFEVIELYKANEDKPKRGIIQP